MNRVFTINFEPLPQGGLQVFIPEINACTQITGMTRDDAIKAGQRLIIEHLEAERERKQERAKSA